MTLKEVGALVFAIDAVYKSPFKGKRIEDVAKIWFEFLEDEDKDSVFAALKDHVKASGFPPNIKDLISDNDGWRFFDE